MGASAKYGLFGLKFRKYASKVQINVSKSITSSKKINDERSDEYNEYFDIYMDICC